MGKPAEGVSVGPSHQLKFSGADLRQLANESAYDLNAVVNGLVKEGREFAGMTSIEFVVRCPWGRIQWIPAYPFL